MSEKYCIIDNKKIFYTIKKNKKQKCIRLIVYQNNSLVVTAPKTCKQSFIEKELMKNSEWIKKQIGDKGNVTIDESVIRHMKKSFKPIVEAKLLQFNSYYNFKYNRISVRHQKTRWGSCSSEGNLNFNCKLICLSNKLQEYVIVHELCHLREMNHSKDFWQLVEKTIPNYKELRKKLKNIKI